MELIVRGFKKTTLAKYTNLINQPLLAISEKDQTSLGLEPGIIDINNYTVRLIIGTKDGFAGMTKTLRRLLSVNQGQKVNIVLEKNKLNCLKL